jgi:hypothetical protein
VSKRTVLVSDMSGEEIPDEKVRRCASRLGTQGRACEHSTSPIPKPNVSVAGSSAWQTTKGDDGLMTRRDKLLTRRFGPRRD